MKDNKRNPNWEKNLRPHWFKKGESGNPGGRPKNIPEIKKLLAEVLGEEDGLNMALEILKVIRKKALDGDIRAAEVLLDRAYGRATTNIEVNSEGITIKVLRDGNNLEAEESAQRADEGTTEG